ncbi:hypothetical protein JFU13_00430 [Peribacillus sp. TH24]|nr:hypothetical protein [Peribacillus sp. TH24]
MIHFVDPALMHRVTSDDKFKDTYAQKRVKEQTEWIAECKVGAILFSNRLIDNETKSV